MPSANPGYRVDVVEAVFVALLAVAFTVAAFVLRRDLKENPPGAPPLVEPSDPDYELVMIYERSRKRRQWLIVASPLLVMGGCCGYNVYDSLQMVKEAAEFKACFNNELQLDPAIQAFVTVNRRPPRSVQAVIDSAKAGLLRPACPARRHLQPDARRCRPGRFFLQRAWLARSANREKAPALRQSGVFDLAPALAQNLLHAAQQLGVSPRNPGERRGRHGIECVLRRRRRPVQLARFLCSSRVRRWPALAAPGAQAIARWAHLDLPDTGFIFRRSERLGVRSLSRVATVPVRLISSVCASHG